MNLKKALTVCVSGGFDPLHIGHIRLIRGASNFGRLIIILNSDEWLIRKHGAMLQSWPDRKETIMGVKGVDDVVHVDDSDDTVCSALSSIKPDIFANGGLRNKENTPERELCEKLGIRMFWGIGGASRDDYTAEMWRKIRKI